jgi:hypothetical protein
MNDHLKNIMKQSWADWHKGIDPEMIGSTNPLFEKGFSAAASVLLPLLKQCHPHVYGSHGALHMMDGFKPKPRPIDGLMAALEEVLHDPT